MEEEASVLAGIRVRLQISASLKTKNIKEEKE